MKNAQGRAHPLDFPVQRVRVDPRVCSSNKFSGDASTAGPGTTLGEPLIYSVDQRFCSRGYCRSH